MQSVRTHGEGLRVIEKIWWVCEWALALTLGLALAVVIGGLMVFGCGCAVGLWTLWREKREARRGTK